MSDTPELRPCPWPGCGHEKPELYPDEGDATAFVRCLRCGMDGPLRPSDDEAAAAWNELPRSGDRLEQQREGGEAEG